MQEVFAGFLAYTDSEIGRLIDTIDQLGELDNTLVFYIVGDNGASPEGGVTGTDNEGKRFNGIFDSVEANRKLIDKLGGPMAYNNYAVGWAYAGSTPFKWTKQIASHFGGTRNPLVISWPKRIRDKGGLRSQFHHVVDIAPTIYEAVGIRPPAEVNGIAQKPIEGVSLAYTFDHAEAKGTSRHAIFRDGRQPGAISRRLGGGRLSWPHSLGWPFRSAAGRTSTRSPGSSTTSTKISAKRRIWPKANPKKLRELQSMFWIEAAKYHVLPIDDRTAGRMLNNPQPQVAPAARRRRSTRGSSCRKRSHRTPRTARTPSRPSSIWRNRGPKVCSSPRGAASVGTRSTSRTESWSGTSIS